MISTVDFLRRCWLAVFSYSRPKPQMLSSSNFLHNHSKSRTAHAWNKSSINQLHTVSARRSENVTYSVYTVSVKKLHPFRHSLYTLAFPACQLQVMFPFTCGGGHLEAGLLMSQHVVGCADNPWALMYINRQGALSDPHSTDLDRRMFPVTQSHTCPGSDECSCTPLLSAGKYPGQSRLQVLRFWHELVNVFPQGSCGCAHPER